MNKSIAPLMKKAVATGLVGLIVPLSAGAAHAAGLPLIGSLKLDALTNTALGLISTAPAKAVLDTAASTAGAAAGVALEAEKAVAGAALGAAGGVLETAVGVAGAGLGVALPVVQGAVGEVVGTATGLLGAAAEAAPVLQPVAPIVAHVAQKAPGVALGIVGTATGLVSAAPETVGSLVGNLHSQVIGLVGDLAGAALGAVGTVEGIALSTGDAVLVTVGGVVKGVPVAKIADHVIGQAAGMAGPLVGIVTALPAKGLEVVNLPIALLQQLDPAGVLRILSSVGAIDVPVSALLNAEVVGKVLSLQLP